MKTVLYLFDIDGTLVHCQGAGRKAFERACAPFLGPGALVNITLDGKTDPLILQEAFSSRLGRSPSAEEAGQIEKNYTTFLAQEVCVNGTVTKLPFVDEVLALLEGSACVLGLATGNWRKGAAIKLGAVGLWESFVLGGFGCDRMDRGELVRVAKERGDTHVMRELQREEVLVVGDTPRDIYAAHAAGVKAAGVATGRYNAEALRQAGADRVYEDLSGLYQELAG